MSFLSMLVLIFLGRNLWAESALPKTLILSEVLETARQNNPEIAAARKKWQAGLARVPAEAGYERTTLTYETMYFNRERAVGVSQDFPFPGKLTLRKNISLREASMAEQAMRSKEKEIIAKTKTAYAMLYLAHKAIDIYSQNTDLVRQFAKVAESKYSVGKASQVDVLKAQLELSRMQNMLVSFGQEKETAQAMLNILINQDPEQELGFPEEPKILSLKLDYRELSQAALANRPELLEMQHHVHHSKAILTAARFNYLPDFTAQFRRRYADNPEMNGSDEFMVGAKIPLWFWTAKGAADAARLEAEMGKAEYQTIKNMTLWNIKDLLVKVQAAERLVNLYRTSVIPQAENALQVTLASYRSDRASFLDLIDIQRNLIQFRYEHYQHLADYGKMIAELEQVVGKPLSEVSK